MSKKNNSNKGSATNTFNGGLNVDTHPLVSKNNTMSEAVNIELLTEGGDQFVLKNIEGNLLMDGHGMRLTEGYIPLAAKVFNTVAYIVSGKFDSEGNFQEGELGTFPSPVWSAASKGPVAAEKITQYSTSHSFNSRVLDGPGEDKIAVARHTMKVEFPTEVLNRDIQFKLNINTVGTMFEPTNIRLYYGRESDMSPVTAELCQTVDRTPIYDLVPIHDGDDVVFKVYNAPSTLFIQTTGTAKVTDLASNPGRGHFAPCAVDVKYKKEISMDELENSADEDCTIIDDLTSLGLACSSDSIALDTFLAYNGHIAASAKYAGVDFAPIASSIVSDILVTVGGMVSDDVTPEVIHRFYDNFKDVEYVLPEAPLKKMGDFYSAFADKLKNNISELSGLAMNTSPFSIEEIIYADADIEHIEGSTITPLQFKYAPIHNFLTDEFGDSIKTSDWETDSTHTMPFRTKYLNFNIEDFIDLTLQKDYDESINMIFTDGRNPIRIVNTRFKVNTDGNATILDRRQSKDSSTYSSKYFNSTELIIHSKSIPTVDFLGTFEGGALPGGGYRYFFRYSNADGNTSDILAESSLVSVHRGFEKTAYGVAGDVSSGKTVRFVLRELNDLVGNIEVSVLHVSGDNDAVINTYKLNTLFPITENGECYIVHTGVDTKTNIAAEEINTVYSSISTAKTLDQVNNRLALANLTANIDDKLFIKLEKLSKKLRIYETNVKLEGGYGNPKNVYDHLGYWAGETYELGIVYLLASGGLSPAFPIRGLDNYNGDAKYSGQRTGGDDVEITADNGIISPADIAVIPYANKFENVLGVFRTRRDKTLYDYSEKARIATELTVDLSPITNEVNDDTTYIKDKVLGYFIVRKHRIKDTLYSGFVVPMAMMPVSNIEGNVVDTFDWVGFRRNTAVIVNTAPGNNNKFFFGWDNSEQKNRGKDSLHRSSNKFYNEYRLVMGFVPQYSSTLNVVSPGMVVDLVHGGRVPDTNKVAMYSGDMEVMPVEFATVMDSSERYVNIGLSHNKTKISTIEYSSARIQRIISDVKVGELGDDLKLIADSSFVRNGSTAVADSEFTAQIDRSLNFVGTNVKSMTRWLTYNTCKNTLLEICIGGHGAAITKRNQKRYFINYVDTNGIRAEAMWRQLKVGDEFESEDRIYPITGLDFKSTKVYISSSTHKTIGSHGVRKKIRLRYVTDNRTIFALPKVSLNHVKAYGYKESSGEVSFDEQLWGNNEIGINRSSVWKLYRDGTWDIIPKVYPYSSVVQNYSQYVGLKLREIVPVQSEEEKEFEFNHNKYYNYLYPIEVKVSKSKLSIEDLISVYSGSTSKEYFSTSPRKRFNWSQPSLEYIAGGDCFISKVFKRTSYAIGIPEAVAANVGDAYTYGTGPIREYVTDREEKNWKKSAAYEEDDEGRKLIPNGQIVELISQTNHNADVRSIEDVDEAEKKVFGSGRGFYPKITESKLYSEYRPDSAAYNVGYSGLHRVVTYVGINNLTPVYNLTYPNRVMLSSINTQSEFFNGYREFYGINYRDYNSELGQIEKLVTTNNALFAVFEKGVANIIVDGRTLINSKDEIYVDAATALGKKAKVLSSSFGTVNPESIGVGYSTIYGVDLIRNKVWRLEEASVKILSDYTVESILIEWRNALNDVGSAKDLRGIPKVYTSFDPVKKNMHFSYTKLLNVKDKHVFFNVAGSIYYNEVLQAWVSKTSFIPKFQFKVISTNNMFDVIYDTSNAWETGASSLYSHFYGKTYPFEVEIVMNDTPATEKILTNLQLLSNKVKPEEIVYTVTTDVNDAALRQNKIIYYDDDGKVTQDKESTVTEIKDKIYIREEFGMGIGIFHENAYYKDGKYFVQVGKTNSFSRTAESQKRIRDKYFKIKLKYTGNDYTYIYAIISLFTINYD